MLVQFQALVSAVTKQDTQKSTLCLSEETLWEDLDRNVDGYVQKIRNVDQIFDLKKLYDNNYQRNVDNILKMKHINIREGE